MTQNFHSSESSTDATEDEALALAEIGYGGADDRLNLTTLHYGVLEALRKGYELGRQDGQFIWQGES